MSTSLDTGTPATPTTSPEPAPRKTGGLSRRNITQFTLIIELVVIFVLFAALTGGVFLYPRNLTNLLMQSVTFALVVIPMVLVMVEGHIDLSVGSVIGFLGTVAACANVNMHLSAPVTIGITVVLGAVVGLWHGYWVAVWKLPAFIVTLTGLLLFRGLTLLVGGGNAIGPVSDGVGLLGGDFVPSLFFPGDTTVYAAALAIAVMVWLTVRSRRSRKTYGLVVETRTRAILKVVLGAIAVAVVAAVLLSYAGLSWAMLLLIVVAAVFGFIADNTPLGRHVYAIGGNGDAARLSGVNTRRTTLLVFLLMGVMTGIAAIVYLGRVGSATADAGTNFEFDVITGAIVGGVSTLGGRGRIVGAIVGTILMASLDNGMSLMNLGSTYQYIVKALVLLSAVAVDVISRRKRA